MNGFEGIVLLDDYSPPGQQVKPIATLSREQRDKMLLAEWLDRDIAPRDYLLGSVFSTSSRTILYGETGIGKTLIGLAIAGAIASGQNLFGWKGQRRARVLYIDGELPSDTFQERMQLVADQFGHDIELFAFNRFDLEDMGIDMPALNTVEGERWLMAEIEAIKPDAIFFDSIMCLTIGSMSEEESWAPLKPLVRKLSGRRIAQFWLHHTGHDVTRAFGTKTREWEFDTVISLSKADSDADGSIKLEFKKSRLKTPATAKEFEPRIIQFGDDGWTWTATGKSATTGKSNTEATIMRNAFVDAYDRLADGVTGHRGHDGKMVRKVSLDVIRDELRNRGFLEIDDKGQITRKSRNHLYRAKRDFLDKKKMVEDAGLIWRI